MEIKYRVDLNKLLPPKPITVELGVAEGLFSGDILRLWKPKIHYMVDLWESRPEFKGDAGFEQGWHDANHQKVVDSVKGFSQARILRGETVKMADRVKNTSVDIVYIDACHAFECVRDDIKAWWPKLKPGGIMAFHDYENTDYGVKQAVQEFANSQGITVHLLPENKWEDAGAYIIKPK